MLSYFVDICDRIVRPAGLPLSSGRGSASRSPMIDAVFPSVSPCASKGLVIQILYRLQAFVGFCQQVASILLSVEVTHSKSDQPKQVLWDSNTDK